MKKRKKKNIIKVNWTKKKKKINWKVRVQKTERIVANTEFCSGLERIFFFFFTEDTKETSFMLRNEKWRFFFVSNKVFQPWPIVFKQFLICYGVEYKHVSVLEWKEHNIVESIRHFSFYQLYILDYSEIHSRCTFLFKLSVLAGWDTRSIFKLSLAGLNSEFSFSYTGCLTKTKENILPYY